MKLSNNNRAPRDFEDKRADRGKREPLSRYATLKRRRRRNRKLRRLLSRALLWLIFAGGYYALYSTLFDTHFEQVAERSINRLEGEYEQMLSRYDSLELILENLTKRDSAIFRSIFEAPLCQSSTTNRTNHIDNYEAIISMPTPQIRDELTARLSTLSQLTHSLEEGYKEMILKVDSAADKGRYIPSIQPIANSSLTKLTAAYGLCMHPFYRTVRMHEGVDYSTPEGTRVFATADGVVERVSNLNSTAGKTIIIDHGNGYKSSYKHLGSIGVRQGASVKRGDIIALSGNSGLSLSPHLHYQIELNGKSVDPLHYFFLELSPDDYQRIKKIAESRRQSFD